MRTTNRPIGRSQQDALQTMAQGNGLWSEFAMFNMGTSSATDRIMHALAKRGLVEILTDNFKGGGYCRARLTRQGAFCVGGPHLNRALMQELMGEEIANTRFGWTD